MARKPIFTRLANGVRVRGNQSALFRWLFEHHNEFADMLAGVSRPGWQAVADELRAEGLAMRDGKQITPAYARQTWWRVHKAHEALYGATTSGTNATERSKAVMASRRPSMPSAVGGHQHDADDPPRAQFRFAGGLKRSANKETGQD